MAQIIADHTVVDLYDTIPEAWIDEVKKMWLDVPGESHSEAYRAGLTLLESSDATYSVSVVDSGTPEAYTTTNLRASRASYGDISHASGWIYEYGEEDWYTSATAISRTKAHIDYCNTNSLLIAALGYGWCWDMTAVNAPGGTEDPVYAVHWAGTSVGGPEGDLRWGLDSGDTALTGNSICMDSYLSATQAYIDYCVAQGYATKVFFTTGPADAYTTGENAYQRQLKLDHVRSYVLADSTRILFDYTDILAWNNAGVKNTGTWDGHTYETNADDNYLNFDGTTGNIGHIGERGALRLGKALWWMLARMAGWGSDSGSKPFMVLK